MMFSISQQADMALEVIYQTVADFSQVSRRPGLFLPVSPYPVGKGILYHLPADIVRDGWMGKGVLNLSLFIRIIPEHHMEMGMALLPVQGRRPLEMFPPDTVLLRNRADMVLNIPLPCFFVRQ